MTAPGPNDPAPTTSASSATPMEGATPIEKPASADGPTPAVAAPGGGPTGLASVRGPRRLALVFAILCLFGFYGLAQVKLLTAVGGGSMPGPERVLFQYHGDPTRSRLQSVLNPDLSASDSKRMYDRDGAAPDAAAARRATIVAWIEDGAPRSGWPVVERSFTSLTECGMCHSKKPNEDGTPRAKSDLPFDTYEDVLPNTRPGEGLSLAELATSSHNHMFGFTLAALLASMLFTASRWRGPLVSILVVGAFVGAAVDVGCWWLTHEFGSPFQWGVIAGGGVFGLCVMAMALLSLDELALRSTIARLLAPLLARLGLGRVS